jgi:hypothetical protein
MNNQSDSKEKRFIAKIAINASYNYPDKVKRLYCALPPTGMVEVKLDRMIVRFAQKSIISRQKNGKYCEIINTRRKVPTSLLRNTALNILIATRKLLQKCLKVQSCDCDVHKFRDDREIVRIIPQNL